MPEILIWEEGGWGVCVCVCVCVCGGGGYPFLLSETSPEQVKWFISETPMGVHERTSMKEHLV